MSLLILLFQNTLFFSRRNLCSVVFLREKYGSKIKLHIVPRDKKEPSDTTNRRKRKKKLTHVPSHSKKEGDRRTLFPGVRAIHSPHSTTEEPTQVDDDMWIYCVYDRPMRGEGEGSFRAKTMRRRKHRLHSRDTMTHGENNTRDLTHLSITPLHLSSPQYTSQKKKMT